MIFQPMAGGSGDGLGVVAAGEGTQSSVTFEKPAKILFVVQYQSNLTDEMGGYIAIVLPGEERQIKNARLSVALSENGMTMTKSGGDVSSRSVYYIALG